MKQTAEKILREYTTFKDVNQSQTVELLPLTIIDAMEEYATQCQENMADDLEAILNNSIYVDFISKKEIVKYLKSLNKQDNEK
jgi:hypothetical protein